MRRNIGIFIPIQIHPLLWSTLALIVGIIWATTTSLLWLAILIIGAVSASIKSPTRSLPILFSFFAGAATGVIHFRPAAPYVFGYGPFTIVGVVENINERRTFVQQQELLLTLSETKVALLLDTPAPVCIGDTILVTKVSAPKNKRPLAPMSPITRNPFPPRLKGKRTNILLINRPDWHLNRGLHDLNKQMLAYIQKQLEPNTYQLFSLMFLGKYDPHKSFQEIQPDSASKALLFQSAPMLFNYWGIAHYLARSGLHLVIIVILLQLMMSIIPINFHLKRLILACYLGIYAVMSWPTISFTRALLMVALSQSADLINRPQQALHTITVATYLVLLLQPSNLFYADFQLSFGLTFALAWANHVRRQRKRLHEWQTIAIE